MLHRIWSWIEHKFWPIETFYTRGKTGCSDYDAMDLNDHLLDVLIEGISRYIKICRHSQVYSIPGDAIPDGCKCGWPGLTREQEEDIVSWHFQELHEMLYRFRCIRYDDEELAAWYDVEDVFEDIPRDTYWAYHEWAWGENKDRAFDLLKKNFAGL